MTQRDTGPAAPEQLATDGARRMDRSRTAEKITQKLAEGQSHVHLMGAPGFGKRETMDALSRQLGETAVIVDLGKEQDPTADPLAVIYRNVADGGREGDDWPLGDWAAGWARIVERLRARTQDRTVIVIGAADRLFPDDGAALWPPEVLEAVEIVTVSLAPLHLIFPAASRETADGMTVRLGAFPAPQAADSYDDEEFAAERKGAQDREDHCAEGRAWFQHYLAANACPSEQHGALKRIFQAKYEDGRDEVWDGHPLVNMALLERMLDARRAGSRVADAIEQFRLELPTLGDQPLGERLLPFVLGRPGAAAPSVVEAIASAVAAQANGEELDPRQIEWLLASGLARPASTGSALEWTRVATLITQDPNGARGRMALAEWAQRMHLSCREARRRLHEQKQAGDRAFRTALEDVKATFCEDEISIPRDMRVELAESRTIIPAQMYQFRLSYIRQEQLAPHEGNDESDPERVKFDILVFETKADGPRFLRYHIRILSMLGRIRHPALMAFRRGGELRGSVGSDGPPERMFIEIEHTLTPLPAQNLQGLIDTLHYAESCSTEEDAANPVFQQIVHLAEALDLVHAQGIVHRALDFSALARDQSVAELRLVLTGFEYSANLRSEISRRRGDAFAFHRQAIWNLACRAPEAMGSQPREVDPSVDVYAFGALGIMLATGLPDMAVMSRVDDMLPVRLEDGRVELLEIEGEALWQAATLLREDLLREDRWCDVGPSTPRRLLERCLSEDPARRPTMEDLALQLRHWHGDYVQSFQRETEVLHVSYPTQQMAAMLKRMRLVDEDRNLEGPEGEAWLLTKMQEWVDAAKWMHYREGGFPKSGTLESAQVRRESQFILAGPGVVFFAGFFRDHPQATPNQQCLWLAFAIHRSGIMLPDPGQLDQHNPRATTEEITWIPRPRNVRVVPRSDIARLAMDHSWQSSIEELRRRGRLDDQRRRLGREAATVWRMHRDIQLAMDAVKNFPVLIHREHGGESNQYTMQLDEDAFRRFNEHGTHSFLRQVILERENLKAFFADTLQVMGEGGSPQFFIYPRTSGRRGFSKKRVASIILPVRDDKIQIRLEDGQEGSLSREAQMFWPDSFGTFMAADRQSIAIDRLERRSWLMDYLVTPRDCERTLERDVSAACGNMLKHAREDRLRELRQRVGVMLSSDPLHAVQGPPGTGKTTLISALVSEVLRAQDGARILVTSQSHAATDNVLLSVANALVDGAVQEDEEENGEPTIIRLFSDSTRDSVDSEVRRKYSLNAQVRVAQDRMRQSSAKNLGEPSEYLEKAQQHLRNTAKNGYLEVRFKIERSSPLVFATTGAAMMSMDYLKRGALGYDYVLIDEAAKAWAVDLVQPLSLADRAILVGDQNQLPPYGAMELDRILETAQRRRSHDEVPPDLDYLLDQAREGDGQESPYERMKGWLKLFHRLFEKVPAEILIGSNEKRIPLTQSLDRQFRSVDAIGALVSRTFYKNVVDIKNSGPSVDLDRRLSIPLDANQSGFSPAVVWIDTSGLTSREYYTQGSGTGQFRNTGEAQVLARILKPLDLSQDQHPLDRLRVLSPYKAQVNSFKRAFQREETNLGLDAIELERLFETVDGSQGSEADIIAISLCRRFDLAGEPEPVEGQSAAVRTALLKRRINSILGFLQLPERMNVMMSRARHQIILVGDFEYFARGARVLDHWLSEANDGNKEVSFWSDLLGAFAPLRDDLHLSGHGLEQYVRLPAEQIAGVGE